jgi:hypothetical protein
VSKTYGVLGLGGVSALLILGNPFNREFFSIFFIRKASHVLTLFPFVSGTAPGLIGWMGTPYVPQLSSIGVPAEGR